MRRLLLLRHAKAERLQPGGRDHDRVLAARGRADAHKLGVYLARHGHIPDRALVSTSARTRETWAQLVTSFGKAPPVSFEDRIYEATPQAILQVIQETGRETGTLLVVGHNPGMQEFAISFDDGTGDEAARDEVTGKYPTGGLAVFAVDGPWSGATAGTLTAFAAPRP